MKRLQRLFLSALSGFYLKNLSEQSVKKPVVSRGKLKALGTQNAKKPRGLWAARLIDSRKTGLFGVHDNLQIAVSTNKARLNPLGFANDFNVLEAI